MDTLNLIAAVSIMTAITFGQKYIPFVALSQVSNNRELRYLGKKLPASVMLILVLYTLQESSLPKPGEVSLFIPSLTAAIGTAFVHLLFRHALISIAAGVVIFGLLKAMVI